MGLHCCFLKIASQADSGSLQDVVRAATITVIHTECEAACCFLLKRRSLVSFNTSITACERAAAWTKAFTMYHIVRETRWNPNVITYGATASALEKGRQWQLATIVLHQLLASGTRPNLINCNAVVSACEKSAKWQHALLIASQLTDLQLQPLLRHWAEGGAVCFQNVEHSKCRILQFFFRKVVSYSPTS